MIRKSVNHPEAMTAPKEIILPNNWDEKLKINFNKTQKKEIEWIIYRYIEQHYFNERKINFDEIEYRMENIIDGANQILKGYPYPHSNYNSDSVLFLIERELEYKLSQLYNENFSETPSLIMHHISALKEAAVSALNDLKDSHPKRRSGAPTDENLDWFIYELGSIYDQCGGKFSMPDEPSPKHHFYNYLLAINKHLPKAFKLVDNKAIYRAQKMSKLFRNNKENH